MKSQPYKQLDEIFKFIDNAQQKRQEMIIQRIRQVSYVIQIQQILQHIQQLLKISKIIPTMQPQREIKANILIEINNTVMHRLINKQKSLFTSGVCKVAKIDNPNQNTVYFINLNSFYYTINKNIVFAKIQYADTVSYLFPHFENGLSALTMLKNAQTIHNFEEILSNAAVLLPFQEIKSNPEFIGKIDEHCPGVQKQPIHGGDKIKAGIQTGGKYLGEGLKTLGAFLATGVSYVGQYFQKKIEQPTQKGAVAPQTKQKWQTLKNGTSSAFNVSKDLFNKYLSPLVDTGINYGKQVVQKIQTSENSSLKYVKEIAITSGQAATVAFKGLAEGASQVGTELSAQSRKIVNKKYGEDYVQTFLPGENGEKKEESPTRSPNQTHKQNSDQTLTDEHQHLYPKLNETDDEKKLQ